MDWGDLCLQLLGVAPTETQIMRQRVQHTWLESIYQQLHEDADEEVVEQHARAFILRMLGGFIMPDTSGSRVHLMYLPLLDDLSETFNYSWGSVVLACLYRGLSRAVVLKGWGMPITTSIMGFDHIPILAPRLHDNTLQFFPLVKMWSQHLITTNILGHATNIIRGILDHLRVDQFVWSHYRNMNIMGHFPNIFRAHSLVFNKLSQRIHQTSINFIRSTYVAKLNATSQRSMKYGFKCGRLENSVWSTVFLTLKLCITTRNICSGIYKGQGDSSPQTGHILLE
ncbi:hypothetical protein Lal_00039214 [Lupinus albus]|nr:hypothetical protein Lal_00039214 [Lupinus albus]